MHLSNKTTGGVVHDDQHRSKFNSSKMLLEKTDNVNIPTDNAIVPFEGSLINTTHQPQLPGTGNNSSKVQPVSSIGYTDPHVDYGVYTGEVDSESRPHGTGKMKYHNGIVYEGNWIHGCKNEIGGNAFRGRHHADAARERILSGFTSWKGRRKSDGDYGGDLAGGETFAYGMDWADRAGRLGSYTGQVNADEEPDGRGVMKYECGLVAEGEWVKGDLKAYIGGPAAGGAMNVAPSSMSAVGGAALVVSGHGPMSLVGGGRMMMMGCYPPHMVQNSPMNAIVPTASTPAVTN